MNKPRVFELNFKPNPLQQRFIESHAKADLFSSRVGEGKSAGLVWAVLYHTRHNPGARWVIMRDTWVNLERTTLKTFFEWFPPGIAGDYTHKNKTFKWKTGLADGEVIFMGMDDPKDAGALQSMELGGIAMDEAAPSVAGGGINELIFDIGLTRLRQSDMKWYAMKVAENNPDESHWTYRRFVVPGDPEFKLWQPATPENVHNLPADYYERLRLSLGHRPDLVRRFIDGEFGFQSQGKAVTPQWSDKRHLAIGLSPVPRALTYVLWDFGHNPTAILTQKTPLGHWHILDAVTMEEAGAEELIGDVVKPLLATRYRNSPLIHIGDPAGKQREQTSIHRSAVRFLVKELGGSWRDGITNPEPRIEALRAVLHRGTVKVDRDRAAVVWHALRGGWHYHVANTGAISSQAKKDKHSHPGDAMSYGAGFLFPMHRLDNSRNALIPQNTPVPQHFVKERPGLILPEHGAILDVPE